MHHGRVVKRTGDGSLIEFRSVVDAVRYAIEVQRAMVERNAGVAPDKRIEFRIGIHLGDVVEEADGDLLIPPVPGSSILHILPLKVLQSVRGESFGRAWQPASPNQAASDRRSAAWIWCLRDSRCCSAGVTTR